MTIAAASARVIWAVGAMKPPLPMISESTAQATTSSAQSETEVLALM